MNNYAKLLDGQLVAAPSEMIRDGRRYLPPTDEMFRNEGYKAVIYPDAPSPEDAPTQPSDAMPMIPMYTQDDTHIYVNFVPVQVVAIPSAEELRKEAYRIEADQYLTACEGYVLEGKTAEAEEQKVLYLAKKNEIRERFPDAES